MSHEYLFSLTVYRDGQIRYDGKSITTGKFAAVLRDIADAIEFRGALPLGEYGDDMGEPWPEPE